MSGPDAKARRVLVLNGPNLGRLGKREPAVYGTATYADLSDMCQRAGEELGFDVDVRQTEYEGELVTWIHEACDNATPVVLNAGALTHYSYALMDAVKMRTAPLVEVHISNIAAREGFRHESVITGAATGIIAGFGFHGLRPGAARHRGGTGRRPVIVVVGFMGAGKTTVGPPARRPARPALRRQRPGHRGPGRQADPADLRRDGEPAFRALEHQVIADLLNGPDIVLALGGGAVGTRAYQETAGRGAGRVPASRLRRGASAASAVTAGARCSHGLTSPTSTRERQAGYSSVATITVDVDGRSPDRIGTDVLNRIGSR